MQLTALKSRLPEKKLPWTVKAFEFPAGMKNLDFDKLSEISKRTQ